MFEQIRPTVRRLVAIAGAALAGTMAALVMATPASAHDTSVSGTAVCPAGEWVVTWKVTNSESDITGKITEVVLTPVGTTVSNIAVGATLPKQADGPLTGVQKVAANEKQATLSVKVEWQRKDVIVRKATGTVVFEGTCEKPKTAAPGATFKTACDGQVTVTLTNGENATRAAAFTVVGKDNWSEKKTVEPGQEATVVVPAANSQEVTVLEGEKVVATGARATPANCGGLPVTGVQAGAIAGGALALLGAGAALFLVARRRRIQFTS